MSSETKSEETRIAYETPRLRPIELAADEVLGVGCKLVVGGSDVENATSCTQNSCVQEGS